MKKILLLTTLTVQFIFAPVYAQTKEATEVTKPEPPRQYPKQAKTKAWWEHALSFPGDVINFPFGLLFDGLGWTTAKVIDSKLIPRVQDFMTADDGSRGVVPTSAPQAGFGFKYYQLGLPAKQSVLGIQATWGLLSRQAYGLSINKLPLWGNSLYGDFAANYGFYPDELFYGIGNQISTRQKASYALRSFNVQLGLGFHLHKHTALEIQTGYSTNNTLKSKDRKNKVITDIYQPSELPGLKVIASFFQIQPTLKFDFKNRQGNPNAGWDGEIGGGLFLQANGDDFGFWKMSTTVNRYVHLFRNRVLVLKAGGEMTESVSGKAIPFYYLSQLGKSETVRGFERGRYRDKDSVWGSLEYRYPIRSDLLDFVLFADAGQVADNIFKKFSLNHLKPGFGGGLRIWTEQALVARLELGKSKDGFRFYFILNQDF